MKSKGTRRLATIFLSLFLVCICLATVFAFPVSAAAASNNDYVYKTDYTTKDKKPTYTATLNENNKLLKELNKKENKVLKKVRSEGKDWVNDGFAFLKAMKDSSAEGVDWEKTGVEFGKNILTSIAGIWGFDGIAGALLDGIESLTSSGQAPLSEVQVLSDDIDKRFNAISDQLYDIEEQLGALSNQVTSTANDVLSGTQTQINNLEAKQILRSFMSSGEGNFSYLEFSNYLYGNDSTYVNSSEAYYILLLEAIASGADEAQIEYYYNKLFESLYSNIHIYNQYYYGDIAGLDKSMAAYYYDYLSYNPNLVDDGTSAEYQALLFALDLYTTYVYSYEILEMCFAYQATDMYLEASLKGRDILGTDTYEYAEDKKITYSTIQEDLIDMQANLVTAEEQIVADIAYILGMKDSYIAVDKNGDIHNVGNYGDSFGNVAKSQTIYLNIVPDEICSLFDLDVDNFKYYVNSTEYRGSNKGVICCESLYSEYFTASVKFGDTELYSIEFKNIDLINENPQNASIYAFSGGSGAQEDPYLISNAVQFYMVEDDLNACYRLISNITVSGTHSPIGTEKKPFNGIFDGNGYSITNLTVESLPYDSTNITMTPSTGMFGTIGRNGIVKNLTLNAIQVSSDHQKDSVKPESDISYYCIGGIAGINRGLISNCTITDNSSIVVNRLKQTQDSRTVEIYIGGIAGNNNGVIEYCSTDDLAITADSYLYYYNESTSKNQHSVYMGGIAAITSDKIQYCRVSSNTTLSAYAKSIADSEDREKPILSVYVGGIIADDSAVAYISNVFSNCNIIKCKGDIYNEGTYWGSHRYSWDKVSLKEGLYYPTFFPLSSSEKIDDYEMHFYDSEYQKIYNENYQEKCDEKYKQEGSRQLSNDEYQAIIDKSKVETKQALIEKKNKANLDALTVLSGKIISTYNDLAFKPDNDKLDITIELANNICDINAKALNEYFNKLIDEENEVKNIKFVDVSGNAVNATVVGYYGFNTYHEFETAQTITVKVFFYVNDTLMSDDVSIVVKAKEIVDWKIEGFIDTSFDKGLDEDACKDEIFKHGFKLIYTYSNGETKEYFIRKEVDENGVVIFDNTATVMINGFTTSDYGEKQITIIHLEQPTFSSFLTFKQNVIIECHHTNSDFIKVGNVDADCKFLGYEIWRCNKDGVGCGEVIHKNYVMGDHTYIVKSGQAATCHEAGYTQEVSCSVCGEIFEATEWIQALPHNYVSSSENGYKANELYPAAEYHYCTNGDHYEAHQYTVSEYVDENGTLVYLYSCFCRYENPVPDYNIKTKENGEKPVVVVTNGHILNVGDEVVVYVQIINNPGFKGATFGIRYDNGLELISADESMIVPQQLKVRNEVYNGYNFLWAEGDGNKTTEDGYLLKLTFRYIDEAESEQHISVVYGMSNGSEGGFCTLDDGYHMFMTQSGTISVVEHLPGDVNNDGNGDGVVDIMDATYIAWSIVGKVDENGNKIQVNARYADVNLDGTVDLLDVLAILQSISGRYGTSLLSSDYKLFFELNGFICNGIDESVMVEFYDKNGNRTKWSENVDFVKYEALMKQFGYTFAGWYTRMDCTCIDKCIHAIEATDFIAYDKYQGNQTLYARWEKNKIIFDMGGANCEQFDEIVYSKDNASIILEQPTWSYDIDYIVDKTYYDDGRIYKDFLGWWDGESYDEDGNKVYITHFDLSQFNIGTINLIAVWSEYKWTKPDKIEDGYHIITNWYIDEWYKTGITDINATDVVNSIVRGGCKIHGERNPIEYSITYKNTNDVVNNNSTKYYVTDTFTFKNLSNRTGYEFVGWIDENGNLYTNEDSISEVINSVGLKDITLTAKWTANVYAITVYGVDINNSRQNDSKGNPKYNSATLTTIYFTFGDETKSQGFYKQVTCIEKIPTDYFEQFCIDNTGKINFTFGGLYSGIEIVNNGHSYASYASNIAILSSDGQLFSEKLEKLSLSEESKAGILYALLVPKQYTITLNYNTSSKPALSVTNTNSTQSVKSYYNEVPNAIATMPQSTYYVPSAYSLSDGTSFFNSTGTATQIYSISGNTTMYCQWGQKYTDYTYIYDKTTLEAIGASADLKYLVICDIDMGDATWTPKDSFAGELDGDGHCIYNFSIDKTGGSGTATIAFIKKNTGTIKDFIIGKAGITTYDSKYSVKYNISYKESSGKSSLTVGGFVGENSGTMTGCSLINTYINATFADNDNNEHLYLYVGGIATFNYGTISDCHVEISNIDANATCPKESGDDNHAWLGGICGKNSGTLSQCTVKTTTLDLDVRGDGYFKLFDNNDAYPWGAVGVIVGEQLDKGTTISSTVSGNTVKTYGSKGDYTHPSIYYNNKEYTSKENTFTDNAKCGKNTGGGTVS